uniref:Putative secreted protein n=1 Tax=Anopheles darlingi TaxID=43151 RepID=A0A2M4D4B4_ANODA
MKKGEILEGLEFFLLPLVALSLTRTALASLSLAQASDFHSIERAFSGPSSGLEIRLLLPLLRAEFIRPSSSSSFEKKCTSVFVQYAHLTRTHT